MSNLKRYNGKKLDGIIDSISPEEQEDINSSMELDDKIARSIELEEKLTTYRKDTLTTFMSAWFDPKDHRLILQLLNVFEGCLIAEDYKNKAGAEVTTQQQPASNLMS